ncbi:MAG: dihydrodipicolinate synthase family protein [Isosphaeraceae bacterium]
MAFDPARLDTVQVVPPTPFSADAAQVRPDALGSLARWLYEAGMRVFLPAAGTGEFRSLTPTEVATCVSAVRSAVGADAVVIAPGRAGTAARPGRGPRGDRAGADALLVMPPVHPYLCDAGVRDYLRVLMDALPLPFLAYKKGPFPSDDLLGELGATGRLVGVKYAVNELDAVSLFVARGFGDRLAVSCGTAERFAPLLPPGRSPRLHVGRGEPLPSADARPSRGAGGRRLRPGDGVPPHPPADRGLPVARGGLLQHFHAQDGVEVERPGLRSAPAAPAGPQRRRGGGG